MCASHVLQAGAAEKDVPLYKHIADLAGNSKLVRLPASQYVIVSWSHSVGCQHETLHGCVTLLCVKLTKHAAVHTADASKTGWPSLYTSNNDANMAAAYSIYICTYVCILVLVWRMSTPICAHTCFAPQQY